MSVGVPPTIILVDVAMLEIGTESAGPFVEKGCLTMETSPVGMFMKAPRVGDVKTRLGESIGMRNAAEFYAVAVGWLLWRLESAGVPTILFYDPPEAEDEIRRLYNLDTDRRLIQQEGDDLGERMYHALDFMEQSVEGPPIIIGSDSPDLPTGWIIEGTDALDHNQMVLGPARDGGFYLIGHQSPSPDLFDGIEWSTSTVLRETVRRAKRDGIHPYMLPRWRDIDTIDDLMARI